MDEKACTGNRIIGKECTARLYVLRPGFATGLVPVICFGELWADLRLPQPFHQARRNLARSLRLAGCHEKYPEYPGKLPMPLADFGITCRANRQGIAHARGPIVAKRCVIITAALGAAECGHCEYSTRKVANPVMAPSVQGSGTLSRQPSLGSRPLRLDRRQRPRANIRGIKPRNTRSSTRLLILPAIL